MVSRIGIRSAGWGVDDPVQARSLPYLRQSDILPGCLGKAARPKQLARPRSRVRS